MKKYSFDIDDLGKLLKDKGLKPSVQRMRILEYLLEADNHPAVDEIYLALTDQIPTLSKTTVYNTLKSLEEAGIVRILNIEGTEARYDAIPGEHGHFKCLECGKIYDFQLDMSLLDQQLPRGFQVSEKDVYLKGVCESCLKKMN